MNCKPGDLAVIVRSKKGHLGKLVHVLCIDREDRLGTWEVKPLWNIKLPSGKKYFYIPDSQLKPIRPNDGQDETLTWAGKPEQVTA